MSLSVFNITTQNTMWFIDNNYNPTIDLIKGHTYKFNINAYGHPFWIKISPVIGTIYSYNSGIQNNGIEYGQIIFNVPLNCPNILYYNCEYHLSMVGIFNIYDSLNKVGPMGPMGPQGETGSTGPQGETGPNSDTDSIGLTSSTVYIGPMNSIGKVNLTNNLTKMDNNKAIKYLYIKKY